MVLLVLVACSGSPRDGTGASPSADSGGTEQVTSIRAAPLESIGSIVEVTWQQHVDAVAHVTFEVDGEWRQTPAESVSPGEQTVLLLGIPYSTEVELAVVSGEEEYSGPEPITTDPSPPGLLEPDLLVAEDGAWDGETPYILYSTNGVGGDYGGPWWTVIVDRKGRMVWAFPTPLTATTLYPRPSANGTDLLIDHNTFWVIFSSLESEVVRMKIDGSTVQVHDTPHMGHAFVDLPDGTLVWVDDNPDVLTLVKRTDDEEIHEIWSCADFLHELGVGYMGCGTNSLSWDADADRFLISSFSNESVMEIDHQTGTLVRYFGHLTGAWAFSPSSSMWWWQHGANFTEEGTLLVSTRSSEEGTETLVREYLLDEETETLVETWQFGTGEGIYGSTLGEAHRLPGGNTLHNYGSHARMREITPEGDLVWELWLGGDDQYLGRSTPLGDLYAFVP